MSLKKRYILNIPLIAFSKQVPYYITLEENKILNLEENYDLALEELSFTNTNYHLQTSSGNN